MDPLALGVVAAEPARPSTPLPAPQRPGTPPTPPDSARALSDSSKLLGGGGGGGDVSSEDEDDSVSRPSLYPGGGHVPRASPAPFEEYYGSGPRALRDIEILSELKDARLEGLYNLSFLLLIFSLLYLAVRNVAEHGWRAGVGYLCTAEIVRDTVLCSVYGVVAVSVIASIALFLVLAHIRLGLPRPMVLSSHLSANLLALFFFSFVITRSPVNPLAGGLLSVLVVICVLKTHSYVVTNMLMAEEKEAKRNARLLRRSASAATRPLARISDATRESTDSLLSGNDSAYSGADGVMGVRAKSAAVTTGARRRANAPGSRASDTESERRASSTQGGGAGSRAGRGLLAFPRNVTLGNYLFFLAAPTLTYELNYPRALEVRGDYIAWHALQVAVCLSLQYLLLMQFCVPVFLATPATSFGETVLLVMRLAIPAFIIFLLTFWAFFHCVLSLIAESLRFADRRFYGPWFNQSTISGFWRRWNIPVHEWCLRHIFIELNGRRNIPAQTAAAATFAVSALLHEYCVANGK